MNFEVIKHALKMAARAAHNNSSVIMTGAAVSGVAITAAVSYNAGVKIGDMVSTENARRLCYAEENGVAYYPMTQKEIFKASARRYIVPVISAGVTIGFIITANRIDAHKKAVLASAYALSERTLQKYQDKITEMLGEETEEKIRNAVTDDEIKANPPSKNNQVVVVDGGVTFKDSFSGRYFKSTIAKVEKAGNKVDRDLNYEMQATLNDLYYELGMPNIPEGDEFGWDIKDGMLDLDVTHTALTPDGTPCIVLQYRRPTAIGCPF